MFGGYTAILRKVVGKCARDNSEKYCGKGIERYCHCSSKKFERMTREAMDVCLRVLKERKKSRFDNCSVRNSVFIISHLTCQDFRVYIFPKTFPQIALNTIDFPGVQRGKIGVNMGKQG